MEGSGRHIDLFLSLSHTHTQTHTHIYTRTRIHTHTQRLKYFQCALFIIPSCLFYVAPQPPTATTHTHTHTHTLPPPHHHTHTHTHVHTLPRYSSHIAFVMQQMSHTLHPLAIQNGYKICRI